MKNYYLNLFLIALSIVAFSSCKSTKNVAKAASKAYSPAGTWEYAITGIPDGDQSGTMTLTNAAEGLVGNLVTDAGKVELDDVVLTDNVMTCSFSTQGYDILMEGTFVGEKFTGNIEAAGYEFPITATRKP